VDARERLRLYLEQRRELGESELVLDGLPVEDVLALLGAANRGGQAAPARARARTGDTPSGPTTEDAPPRGASSRESSGPDGAASTPSEPVAPPPAPTPRFDPSVSSSDWRAVLRAQGLDTPGAVPAPITPAAPGGATPPIAPPAVAASAPALFGGTSEPAAAPPSWLLALDVPLGLSVGHALPAPKAGRSLADVERDIAGCAACALGATALHHVPGEGNPTADFVCVGEAPGQTEDETGRPFVGAAGQLLTKILSAIKFAREDVFICNVLKHRPPGNRTPAPDEVHACRPFLEEQLALVQPKVILALGTSAAHALLNTTQSLGALRGRLHRYHGIPVIVTYHPAALLRNEAWKRPTWDDVQLARRVHDAALAASVS
jgi:uracil-DNA glycosylase